MVRYLSWLANAALLTLGCFLVANTANAVFAALLTPSPAQRAPAPAPEPQERRSWSDRQTILDRNLFKASMLAPPPPPVEVEEELQATKLPLDLLGTVASPNPQLSWAAIEDTQQRKHLVLQMNDDVKEGQARVVRIEPKRVVLSENGELRELVLAEDDSLPPPPGARSSRKPKTGRGASRLRASARFPKRPGLESPTSNVAEILSQARILPKYEDGEMVGVQVNAIQPGSVFEEAGINNGDVITEIGGIKITSPEESADVMQKLSEGGPVTVTIRDEDGYETLSIEMPQ